jgi:hypothetical protein
MDFESLSKISCQKNKTSTVKPVYRSLTAPKAAVGSKVRKIHARRAEVTK